MDILDKIERRHRGWLKRDYCPPARVYLDGVELQRVVAVNRRKGKVRVCDAPIKTDRADAARDRAQTAR